jgi:hypothetical protein
MAKVRQHRQDIQALMSRMPRGTTKVRMTAVCSHQDGDRGCGRRWERCFDLRDPKAPEAFEELIKEARLHEDLYEHSGCIDVRLERRL